MIEYTNDEKLREKLDAMFVNFKLTHFAKGDFLLHAHEQPQSVFMLKEGSVRLYSISKNGSELVLHIFRPYSFFPLTWALNDSPNVYYYEAMTPVELYKLSKEKLFEIMRDNPDILMDILRRAYRGIDAILAKMMYQMSGSAYGKVLSEIMVYSKRFGQTYYENSIPMMRVVISERDLASQSGLTRETVSREIKILKDKGILTFSKNNLTIIAMDRLEKELIEAS